jgi:hypothetical protein
MESQQPLTVNHENSSIKSPRPRNFPGLDCLDGKGMQQGNARRANMGRALILWLLGIPIPILIVLWLFGFFH